MNKVVLMGRLTKEPADYNGIVKFTVAVPRRKKDESDFISCIAFNKTGELIRTYFHKGQRIALVGRLETGSYEKDGRKVYTSDVIVDEWDFVEKKEARDEDFYMPTEADEEDLPF